MKAQELRINNWLILNGEWVSVDIEVLQDILTAADHGYKPIPLTPEILEKAGFVAKGLIFKHEKEDFYIGINDPFDLCVLQTINQDPAMVINGIHFSTFNNVGKPFQYLHQLQNLIFVLTGEELNINL